MARRQFIKFSTFGIPTPQSPGKRCPIAGHDHQDPAPACRFMTPLLRLAV